MTAHAMASARERCLAAGMDDYLGKPIRIADLDTALRRLVPRSESTVPILDGRQASAGRSGRA